MKISKQIIVISIFYCLLQPYAMRAQTTTKTHSFEYQKGRLFFNENNVSPGLFSGTTYQLNYRKSIVGKTHRFFQIGAGSSGLRPHIFRKPQVAISNISFEYAYLMKTYSNNRFESYSGIGASLNYNHSYHFELEEHNIQWANFRGLFLAQRFSKRLENNNSIHHHFSLPVLLFLNRSDNENNNSFNEDFIMDMFRNIHQNTERISLNKGTSFNYCFEYEIDKQKRFHPSFTFSMHHFSLQTSYSQRVNSFRMLIGIKYGF